MNILITGVDGLVGKELYNQLTNRAQNLKDSKLVGVGRKTDIRTYKDNNEYDVIIHCAAKKDLVWCQNHYYDAYDINVNGTINISKIKHKLFVHISTDMVNDGTEGYPTTAYGITKREAEKYVTNLPEHLIIRSGIICPEDIQWIDELVWEGKNIHPYFDKWRRYIKVKDYCLKLIDIIDNYPFYPNTKILINKILDMTEDHPVISQVDFVKQYIKEKYAKCIEYKYIYPVSRQTTEHGRLGPSVITGRM